MNYPTISIVTPNFNQGKYLEETILSVLGQNYPNLEYIIIDGGSTDNSVEIIRKYENRLAYWVSEKDRGMYDAIYKGFNQSTGEIMAYINSDDIYHRKAFDVVAEIFAKFTNVEWIMGLPSQIDEFGRIVFAAQFRKWSKYNYLLRDYEWIQQESCFWRRSLWERAGGKFNNSLSYAGDFELWSRFFNHAKLYSLRAVVGAFRLRSKNQFSLDRMEDYKKEVNEVIAERLLSMNGEERTNLNSIRFYQKISSKIPLFRSLMYPSYIKCFDYPAEISFDRLTQTLKID
jgi:glycosyltransferase involved in cell wall biosynthesis